MAYDVFEGGWAGNRSEACDHEWRVLSDSPESATCQNCGVQVPLWRALNKLLDRYQKGVFPVGYVLITSNANDPATYLGYGTWEARGVGRTIVGVDPSDPDFDAPGKMGGAKAVTITTAQLPAHDHPQSIRNTGTAGTAGTQGGSTVNNAVAGVTGTRGSGQPVSLMNPYETAYIWRRAA